MGGRAVEASRPGHVGPRRPSGRPRGATAIEDKLQDGVPEAIARIKEADVKVWVLTGDKEETADKLDEYLEDFRKNDANNDHKAGIVINGKGLQMALDPKVKQKFLDLALLCDVCVCCRVSPKQKADIVRLVRDNRPIISLAIGDGANDVPMIQAAHIGVGIQGVEGMQAVQNADYSLGQFRYLE